LTEINVSGRASARRRVATAGPKRMKLVMCLNVSTTTSGKARRQNRGDAIMKLDLLQGRPALMREPGEGAPEIVWGRL